MSEPTSSQSTTAARNAALARRRWRPRRLHFHLSFWSLVTLGVIALFLMFTSMSLTGRVITMPAWVADRVEQRLNTGLAQGDMALRGVQLGVTPRGRPMLRLVDVAIRDATGLEIGRLNAVEAGFRPGALLIGRVEPTILRLDGAQVTLRRLSDGSFAVQMGQELGTSANLAGLLDGIDAAFGAGPLAKTDRLEASDLTVTLEDARSGRLWQVTDGTLDIVPADKVIDTTIRFDVFNGTEELATTELSFRSARDSSEASLAARFENAAARDIAAQTPALAFLSVIDAPISGALRSTIAPDGAISDLAGTMQIGQGALSPGNGATPARFDGAKVYIDFDPDQQALAFQGFSVTSDIGTVDAEGQVFLADFQGAFPNALIGQITLSQGQLDPEGMFELPLNVERGVADLRITLDPFRIDIGQAVLHRGDNRYEVDGWLAASEKGWDIALDGRFDHADRAEVLALWPLPVEPSSRAWVDKHVLAGEAFDGALAWRKDAGERLRMLGTFGLRNGRARVIATLPPADLQTGYITLGKASFTVSADAASITAPDGTVMDLSGTSYRIPNLKAVPQEGVVQLAMAGPLPGALAILDLPPFDIFARNSYGPDLARGDIVARGTLRFPLSPPGEPIPRDKIAYDIRAALTDVSSDRVIEDKLLIADRLELVAREIGIELSGPVRVGQAAISGSWHLPIEAGQSGSASVTGTIALTPSSLREFGLGALEDMVSGQARAQFQLDFAGDGPPRLGLASDLAGLGMRIPGIGWTKPAPTRGTLEVEALVGPRPEVTRLKLKAAGLDAGGTVTTVEGGGLGEARFERVRVGGWLDAPVVITGRGARVPVAIAVPGGSIDMRRADLGSGSGSNADPGPRRPLTLALDKLIISEGIQIRNLRADLDMAGGLSGTFAGRIIGGARIRGTVAQQAKGAAFRITSNNAGGVLKGANIFQTAKGGKLELILAPTGETGTYEGDFTITDTRLVDAPTMAELLSTVSVVGLIDQLSGEGIGFSEVEGRFRLSPTAVTLYRSSAVNASMGISLDGYYDMAAGTVDMQGVLSPFYLVNSLGRIFSARNGEGLVGFNFTLKDKFDNPTVELNPLSLLTPGAFREIFRRPPPTAPQE